jgi:hypothetical protein
MRFWISNRILWATPTQKSSIEIIKMNLYQMEQTFTTTWWICLFFVFLFLFCYGLFRNFVEFVFFFFNRCDVWCVVMVMCDVCMLREGFQKFPLQANYQETDVWKRVHYETKIKINKQLPICLFFVSLKLLLNHHGTAWCESYGCMPTDSIDRVRTFVNLRSSKTNHTTTITLCGFY